VNFFYFVFSKTGLALTKHELKNGPRNHSVVPQSLGDPKKDEYSFGGFQMFSALISSKMPLSCSGASSLDIFACMEK